MTWHSVLTWMNVNLYREQFLQALVTVEKTDQPGTIKQISQVFRQDCEKWMTYQYIKLYDSISEKQYDTELFSSFKPFWSYKANLWLCFVNFNESINYYNTLLVCLQNSFSLAHQNLFLKLFSLTKHLFLDSKYSTCSLAGTWISTKEDSKYQKLQIIMINSSLFHNKGSDSYYFSLWCHTFLNSWTKAFCFSVKFSVKLF